MATYFTQFACVLDVGSAENVARAIVLYREMELAYAAFEQSEMGFVIEPSGAASIFIHDGDGFGDQEHVIQFVLRCAAEFDLRGRWGFTWALTCSRPRTDGFGGGAQLLDLTQRKSLDWIEPRRVFRRLQLMRRWSYDEQDKQPVFARGARAGGAD